MTNNKSIKKMNEFIDRLFERSKQPLKELEKIYNNIKEEAIQMKKIIQV